MVTDQQVEIARPPQEEEQRQRLAALLLTVPGWSENYTATIETAGWLIGMAEKVGWTLTIWTKESGR